ncbi:hypothetical protein KEM54_001703 [Ascosphaera aggregata]|nr:hypothetical protein KEM54_001703 [Ascosphaera aggregata]
MSYSDDSLQKKLSALNETQECIVTVAEWIIFHKRQADRQAQLWLARIRDSNPHKKLSLIYLANEVVQQSKARRKEDFLIAFSPQIIAEATSIAYKGSTSDNQQRIRRVVEIWRQRHIFDEAIQTAIETRIDEIDRTKYTGKKPLLGGSLFTSSTSNTSIPPEIQPLIPLQISTSKTTATSNTSVTTADAEYDKLNGPDAQIPTPPVYAARLSQLLKSLAHAENSVFESIKSRKQLIEALEQLLNTNRECLSKEESQYETLKGKKEQTEAKKREVEDAIMRGLATEPVTADGVARSRTTAAAAAAAAAGGALAGGAGAEADGSTSDTTLRSPIVEALTPPPVEALTPIGSPRQQPIDGDAASQQQQQPQSQQQQQQRQEPNDRGSFSLPGIPQGSGAPASMPTEAVPGLSDLLQVLSGSSGKDKSSPAIPQMTAAAAAGAFTDRVAVKRRKISHHDDEGSEIARQFAAGGDGDGAATAGATNAAGRNSGGGKGGVAGVNSREHGDVMAGLDEDVAELLRQESEKYPSAGR